MATPNLNELDFERYGRILGAVLPGLTGVAVWDADGRLVWSSSGAERPGDLAAPDPAPAEGEAIWQPDGRGNGGLWRASLGEHPVLGRIGCLGVYLAATGKSVPAASAAHQRESLLAIAACVRREYDLIDELNSMASELTARYEELNLVYHTDDQVNDFEQGQTALQRLVRNCAEAMSVDVALLFLPKLNIWIKVAGAGQGPDETALVDYIKRALLPWMTAHVGPLVLNGAGEGLHLDAALVLPHKLAASPVLDGSGEPAGALVVANGNSRPDFTNSDRNLLEVMARKAAKIIQASFDSLTGLIRRIGFEHYVQAAMQSTRQQRRDACLLHMDVDKMDVVNETLGRAAGDALLRRVARVLQAQVRGSDVVARLAGDEFGVLLDNCALAQAEVVARKLAQALFDTGFEWQGQPLDVTVSVGVVPLDRPTAVVGDILSDAQLACAAAKELGGNQIHVLAQGEDESVAARREQIGWVGKLQAALREDRLLLYAQVIQPVAADAGHPHMEILLRMRDGGGGVLPPGQFLPAAERYHLMPAVDQWVVRQTIDMLSEHCRQTGGLDAVYCVNLSGQSLADPAFLGFVVEQLRRASFPADRLCFEITETAAIARMDQARQFIARIKALGCTFALDDFGSGLSSYAYLKNLAVDFVKIDGGFVKDILDNPVSDAMVRSITQIAHLMGLRAIAEFVENQAILERLIEIGVDFAQGYGIGKPADLGVLLAELETATPGTPAGRRAEAPLGLAGSAG